MWFCVIMFLAMLYHGGATPPSFNHLELWIVAFQSLSVVLLDWCVVYFHCDFAHFVF